MISAGMLDHTATIYGSQQNRGSEFGDVTRTWSEVPDMVDVRVAVQTSREVREDPGGGQRAGGEWRVYGSAGLDVVVGDVIDITAGANAGVCRRVDSVYKPRGRHTELVVVQWDGELS